MSKILRESFEKTVSRLAKRFKSEIGTISLDIQENEDRIGRLPDDLKKQVKAFENMMAYKLNHLERKMVRIQERLGRLTDTSGSNSN